MKKLLLVIFFISISTGAYAIPSFQQVKDDYKSSEALLLDRHGKVIHELRIDLNGRRLEWVSVKDISPALINAVISSEDKRFFQHNGVDWFSVVSAVASNVTEGSKRGASTITMQLVSLFEDGLKPRHGKRTLGQKWKQMMGARQLEREWTKDEIMEAYLNLITFRGELQGISAASRGLYDKHPSGLDRNESLLLAALIRSPNAPSELVAKRACVLSSHLNYADACEDLQSLAQKKLTGSYLVRQQIAIAPHVAYQLLKHDNMQISSTLDADLQRFSSEALNYQLNALKSQNVNDGAVLVVENRTGDILVYIGGTESSARYVDGVRARRQAGSTLKPFLYAIAFEKKLFTPASVLNDSPVDIPTEYGIYKPENYDNDFKGQVSARTALASSLNIPAVRTLTLVGEENFIQKLKHLGFNLNRTDGYYGPSLALGTADVSLYELVNAFRTLANGGSWSDLRLTSDNTVGRWKKIYSEEAVFLVSDILSDRDARSVTFSLENPLSTKFRSAVKTGTSKDMRDNWCVGYSQDYTVGVWVGNFTGEPMWDVSGVSGAAPVWLEIMNYLHKDLPMRPRKIPGGARKEKVSFANRLEPDRDDWFIKGTEPAGIHGENLVLLSNSQNTDSPRILYPPDGAVYAIDPDIPEEQQRIFFELRGSNSHVLWMLDGEALGKDISTVSWKPKPGRHTLSLADNSSSVIESVNFIIKGDSTYMKE